MFYRLRGKGDNETKQKCLIKIEERLISVRRKIKSKLRGIEKDNEI